MQIDKMIEISMLFDFYGQLLSEKQRLIYSLYYENNLSLAEIAAEVAISRQGVHDALKKSEKLLNQYETTLGLIAKFEKKEKAIKKIDEGIDELISFIYEKSDNEKLIPKLKDMKKIIDNLSEA